MGPGEGKGGSTQGISKDHWDADTEVTGWDLGVSTSGNRNPGGRVCRDGGICAKGSECGRPIHYDMTDFGHLRGNGADAGDVGREKVVGSVRTGSGRIEGGGSRRSRRGGEGEYTEGDAEGVSGN